jgi:hypothetical protein
MTDFVKIILFCMLFTVNSCMAQKTNNRVNKIPDGKWVCAQDSLNTILVKGDNIFEYYNKLPIDTTKYILTKQPCDKSYKPIKKETLYFIWHKNLCYEVNGITKEYIELTYTANGKTITYHKK